MYFSSILFSHIKMSLPVDVTGTQLTFRFCRIVKIVPLNPISRFQPPDPSWSDSSFQSLVPLGPPRGLFKTLPVEGFSFGFGLKWIGNEVRSRWVRRERRFDDGTESPSKREMISALDNQLEKLANPKRNMPRKRRTRSSFFRFCRSEQCREIWLKELWKSYEQSSFRV